ncbi:MAG: hypothetical protein V3U90_04615 [Dehalococcoidia bacterium]
MKILQKRWLLTAGIVLALVGAACGGGETTPAPRPAAAPSPTSIATPPPVTEATPTAPTEVIEVEEARFQWEAFDVDEGAKPAIALGGKGTPHIAYMREALSGGFVKHALWNGNGFDITEVARGYFYGPLDIDVGPGDVPQISWHDHQASSFRPDLGDATRAILTDSGWQVETVRDDGHDGWDNRIVVDSQGRPHISAVDPAQFGSSSGVEYYFFDGAQWTVESIGAGPINYEWGTFIALDSQDSPHITYFSTSTGELFYATRTDSGWVIETVDSEGDVGRFSSLVLDGNDNPHIAYFEIEPGAPSTGTTSGYVKYAVRGDSGWETTRIDKLESVFIGMLGARNITSILLDNSGNPMFSYADEDVIKLAYFDGSRWNTETIVTSDGVPFGQLTSLDIDADGVLHLTYTEVTKRSQPGISGTVKYVRGTPISG